MASLLASIGSSIMSSIASDAGSDVAGSLGKTVGGDATDFLKQLGGSGGSGGSDDKVQAPTLNVQPIQTPVSTTTGYDPSGYTGRSAAVSPFSRLLGG